MIDMDTEQEDKATTRKRCRGITRKTMIIKNRSKGIKLAVKYNVDGVYIGQATMHLISYLGVLACTMLLIRYNTWHHVPKQLKNKLWDSIKVN